MRVEKHYKINEENEARKLNSNKKNVTIPYYKLYLTWPLQKKKKKREEKNRKKNFNFFKLIMHVISLERKELFKNALKHLHMGF